MTIPVFVKDPSAKKDYTLDWSAFLDGDEITESDWTVPEGLTEDDASDTATTGTIWLSGGTAGEEYLVTNAITTASGVIDQRSIKIVCRQL